jgi:hypothetical protein
MQEQVSFHKHEVEGARILESRLAAMGFGGMDIRIPKKLVELHQVRFYENTNEKTFRAFLRRLGKKKTDLFFSVLKADRAGNRANDGKPLMTRYMKQLRWKLEFLEKTTVFEEDLCVNRFSLLFMGVPRERINHAINNMTAIVQLKPERNNFMFLTEFVRKNYLEIHDDRSKGLPDW